MKDYNEMAESVFERRDKYISERRMAWNRFKKGMVGAVCCCLIVLFGVSVMRGNQTVAAAPDAPNSPIQSDTVNKPAELLQDQHIEQETLLWLSANDILGNEDEAHMGVYVPAFLSWKGGFYGGYEITADDCFASTEDEVWFNPKYRYTVYQVKDRPGCIAIYINGGMQAYQKLFDVTFELNGVTYGIQYSPAMNTECTAGSDVLSGDGFTVYEVVRLQNESESREYLVNILPLLKEQLPNLFGGDENYRDAWQIATPLSEA